MTGDCGKPYGWVKKMAWAGGEEVWPCAYDMIRKYNMTNDIINEMLVEIDLNGRSNEEVATEWLKNNRDIWEPWTSCAS